MKKRWLITGTLSAGLVLAGAPAALAGEWKQDARGWWWQNDDGTYPVNAWQWLDGNQDQTAECYYFNEFGYLLTDTVTPDNYVVNANGAWVLDGIPQIKAAGIPAGTVNGFGNTAAVKGVLQDGASGVIGDTAAASVPEDGRFGAVGDMAAAGMPEDKASGTVGDAAAAGVLQDGASGVVGDTAAGMSEDGASGAVRDTAAASADSAKNTITGELAIDRAIGKNFIKQIFMECIGRERSQVEAFLGVSGEIEETEDYAEEIFDFHITYELNKKEDVRIDYKNNIAVRIFGTNTELLNFEQDEYSLSEIDAILGIEHTTWEGAHFWHLQDEPEVTIELVDGYASLNAY